MKRTLLTIILLISPALAQDEAARSRSIAACGPAETEFDITIERATHPLAETDPGKAAVYVIEDQKTSYIRDVTLRAGLDGAWMGANRGNSYLFFTVDPGLHHLCTDWQRGGRIIALSSFKAEAGKTYYFRARPWSSVVGQSATWVLDLDAINEDQGRLMVSTSGFSVSQARK